MMSERWCLMVLLCIGLVHCTVDLKIDPVFEPSWTYKCVPEEGCQRAESPLPTSTNSSKLDSIYKTVDICRSVCGRFGSLWPKPVTAALSTQVVSIHPNTMRFDLIDVPAETRYLLAEMTKVVTANLLAECGGNVTEMVDKPVIFKFSITSPSLALTWDTSEQYMLDVQTKADDISVNIVADTIYGARHALESFTQLVSSSRSEFSDQKQCGLYLVSGAKIRDKPVYRHRGFLLDTARNFIPIEDIKRMMDGMAASKMNVFHWHATDSHSFPLESYRVPQFTRYGAYTAAEIYTVEEVQDLIKYAQIRGIRVVIEIDSPAHAGNGWQWGKEYGFGDMVVCANSQPWRQLCIQPPCGQLNPANPSMYNVLRDLYRDIAEYLPKPALFHMGGDEIFFPCWNSSAEITTYMKDKGFSIDLDGFMRLWAEFHAKALQIWDEEYQAAGGEGPQPVMLWSSELTDSSRIQSYLNKDRYVIEVWERISSPLLNQLLRMGYRTVSVPKDIWYLDHGFWGTTKYSNWRQMYSHTLPTDPKMLGGEVAMWSEYVDGQGLDTRVWPRVAAVAERLWSDPTSGPSSAEPRLQRLRSRLVARGLRPDVLSPGWCSQHDTKCL